MKYIRNNNFVLRNIMNKNMLFPIGQMTQEMQGAIILNDIATLIWNCMENYCDKENILKRVLSEYDVEESQAINDIDELLNLLCTNGLVYKSES